MLEDTGKLLGPVETMVNDVKNLEGIDVKRLKWIFLKSNLR